MQLYEWLYRIINCMWHMLCIIFYLEWQRQHKLARKSRELTKKKQGQSPKVACSSQTATNDGRTDRATNKAVHTEGGGNELTFRTIRSQKCLVAPCSTAMLREFSCLHMIIINYFSAWEPTVADFQMRIVIYIQTCKIQDNSDHKEAVQRWL